MTGILAQRVNYDTDRHRGRLPCEDRSRDLGNVSTILWTKYRKLGKRLGYMLLVLSEGINFAKPWALDFCLPEWRDAELLLLKTHSIWQLITTMLVY